jgi:hypothetical protein
MAQYGKTAYLASRDYHVYGLEMVAGRILWRFTADRSIFRKPIATDEDLYITPERGGLFRVNRETGERIWRNPEAERFLAHHRTLVYAMDRYGQFLVLDRARGTQLGSLDLRDFIVPITNELTDRIYLAANDGLIVCLHDRAYPGPFKVTNVPEMKPPPPAKEKPKPKPPAEDTENKKEAAKEAAEKAEEKKPEK